MTTRSYGKIAEVANGSPSARAGLRRGDEMVSIDSKPVRDVLGCSYLASEESLLVEVRRNGQMLAFRISKGLDEELGLEFENDLFDGLHTCKNSCVFCFLHQMPKGLRRSLYVRDDDFRLSFAHGNYITLTNLTDEEMERICSQRMSPMYISVHTTDPSLRVEMLRSPRAARIMDQLKALADARITMHTQIVLCPGINDGNHLERTVLDLSSLHPWVASVAVVPVGLTRHRSRLTQLRTVDGALAREIMRACTDWQGKFLPKLRTRLVFPSDELYLLSGTEFPPTEAYEGFPQMEDGIGVSRLFLDELESLCGNNGTAVRPGHYMLVTGTLAAPLVQRLADYLNGFNGVRARVYIVTNKFLGETVTVAGLLSGRDIASALAEVGEDEEVLIPSIALNEERFLDDVTVADLKKLVRGSITVVPPSPEGVVRHLARRGRSSKRTVSAARRAGR